MISKTYTQKGAHTGSLRKSFEYALAGIRNFFRYERNGKWQLTIAFCVHLSGLLFSISITEWFAIFLFTAMVISMEILNTALEKLCDHIHPDLHPQIKSIKDLSAGAVLWTSIFAVVTGLFIFIPKILALI